MRWVQTRTLVAATGALLLAVTGCASGEDKAGSDAMVLRFATIDGEVNPADQYPGQAAFFEALTEVSGGRITVELTDTWGEGAYDAESHLVTAIAAGEYDGGWPSTRAFASAGFTGLQAVEAPLTLTSAGAVKELASGPVGEDLLQALDDSKLVGLGVVVGPMRQPFAAGKPLLGPEDWIGQAFRSYNSPVQTEAIEALGAEPKLVGFDWIDQARAGTLRGGEFDVNQYRSNAYGTEAGNVTTNVVLWPKVVLLTMNRARFESLSDQQRGWVEEAARIAVDASLGAEYSTDDSVEALCNVGVRFFQARADQLDALRDKVQPVIDGLARDPEESDLLEGVLDIAAKHPRPDIPEIPSDCGVKAGDGSADALASIPDGKYRVDVTLDDVESTGHSNNHGLTGTWTLSVADGTYALACRPNGLPGKDCGNIEFGEDHPPDAILEAGYLRGSEDVVSFMYDAAVHDRLVGCGECFPVPTSTVGWSLDGDELRLTDVGEQVNHATLVIEGWTKIS